jgi:hypothetical protein
MSRNPLFFKIGNSLNAIFLFMASIMMFRALGWQNMYLLLIFVIYPILGRLLWNALSRVHPVYFDKDFLYSGKGNKEQKVPYSNLEALSIISSIKYSDIGELKYFDESGKAKSISFYIISVSDAKDDIMLELKQVVQAKNPDFKITVGIFTQSEL